MVLAFKSQRYIALGFLIILTFIVKGIYILEPETPQILTNNILGEYMISMVSAISLQAQTIIAALIIIIQAWIINWMTKKYELLEKFSWLPAFSYVLLTASIKETNYLTPQLIANLFIILGVLKLFAFYKSEYANKHIIEGGMLFSIAFLFRFEIVFILPVLLYSVGLLRVPNIREMLLILMGFIVPIYFVFSILYILKTDNLLFELIERNLYKINDFQLSEYQHWTILLVLILLFIIGGIYLQNNIHKSMLKIRKMLRLVIVLIPVLIGIAFLDYENFSYNLIYMMFPTSIILANYFLMPKWYWWKETLALGIIAGEIYLPFIQIFK